MSICINWLLQLGLKPHFEYGSCHTFLTDRFMLWLKIICTG